MGMRTVNDPYGNPAVLIDHTLNNSYEVVRKVAHNIDFVKKVSRLFDENGAVIANLHKRYIAVNGQVDFTLPTQINNGNDVTVFVNNLWKSPVTSFVASGTTLSFQEPLSEGDFVDVMILSGKSLDVLESINADTQAILDATILTKNKAQEWAESSEDVEVEPGQYSAKHYAIKASEDRVLAQLANTSATEQASIAVTASGQSLEGAVRAENARDSAIAAAASIGTFVDTTLASAIANGLTVAAEGETFCATGDDVDYIGIYRDDAGSATEFARQLKLDGNGLVPLAQLPTSDMPVSTAQQAALDAEVARATSEEATLADRLAVVEPTTRGARSPGLGAIRPLVMDESGRADLWLTDDGIDGRFARPSALRLPMTGGWRALEVDEVGVVTRGTYDGVPYDPAAIGQPVGEPVVNLSYDQVRMTVLDGRTLAPETRQVTLSQTGDVAPLEAIGPALLKVRGPDPRYPVGAARMPRRNVSGSEPQYLRIVITHGQSNALGGRDEVITPQAALPDHLWMWNGGLRAYVPGASHTWEYIADPAMYANFVPAKFSGTVDQPRDYEGHDLGAGEAVALAYGLRDKVLVQNHGIAGRSVPYLVGDAVSYAPAWQNLRSMVTAAVSQAASMGLIPIIEGLIWNSGEAHDSDTKAYWLEQVELIRSRTDELMSLTGQTRRIPIVFMQVAATKNETGDSRYHEPCMATEEWVRDKSRFATIIPSMWSEQDDVAQVHHKARFYRHAGEMAGKIMVQMHDAGRHDHVMITAASRRGRVVTVEFSEPIVADTYGVSDPGTLGVSYCQGTTYITVRSVEIAGRTMRLTLGTIPSGIDEMVYLGARGAKRYPEYNRWGIGAFWGNRHCIRGLNPESWSHSTCRPLWRWAPQQRFDVTVEDPATSFWTSGVWGGPSDSPDADLDQCRTGSGQQPGER